MRAALNGWTVAGALALALAGCAGGSGSPDSAMTEAKAVIVIQAVLEDIEEIYYRETKTSELVLAGLRNVESVSSGVRFARQGDTLLATVGERQVFDFPAGRDHGAAEYWAGHVATSLDRVDRAQGESVSLAAMLDTFLAGITEALDPSTRYQSREAALRNRQLYAGKQGSVGISLKPADGGAVITGVYDSVVLRDGTLEPGTLVISIDGARVAGLDRTRLAEKLVGPVASSLTLEILRPGKEQLESVSLIRRKIEEDPLRESRLDEVLLVQMLQFTNGADERLREVLAAATADATASPRGIVLDLRHSPGGLLKSTVNIAGAYLGEGLIFTSDGRHEDSYQTFDARKHAPANSLPLVVLVSEMTASGAEIVASALQDNGRAVVVGQATFGRGTIQTVLPLPNGGEFIVTWAEMTAAAGYRLDKRGLLPAVCTGGDATAESVLAKLRNGGVIDYVTRTRNIDPADTAAVEAFRALCPPRSDGADVSLEVARALLADPALFSQVLAAASQ